MGKPKIRFKGFDDDWEQRKVTDLGEIYIGLVTTMTEHYTDKGHLLIRNSDIKDGYFEFGENPIYLDEEFSEQNKSRMHQLGDVITVHTGDIGTSAVIGENEVNSIGFATIVTRPNQEILDSNYFATYLNTDTHKQWAISMATGDGRSNYNLKDYTKLVVPIPEIEEQKKIATCIVNLNSLITLHQRKCDETKKLKKYMLQKMFPQNGQTVPEIRFSGFTDVWEQRKLGEITVKIGSGKTPSGGKSAYVETGIPLIRSQNVNNDKVDFADVVYIDKSTDESMSNSRVYTNDVLLNITGASIGRSAVYKGVESANVNQHVCIIRQIEGYQSDFIQLNLSSDNGQKQIDASQAGGGREGLNFQEIGKMQFSFPTLNEQKCIGRYFNNLDHLITLHQQKCDELRNIKKFMLQNMFA